MLTQPMTATDGVDPGGTGIDQLLSRLTGELRARTPKSADAHARAQRVLPGGETRSVTTYAPYPIVMAGGQGAILTDLDGHRYIDVVNNYTSLVHGNAFAPAQTRVAATLPAGVAFASPHPLQVELADALLARLPSGDLVRFTNSGTEAALLAARIAAQATNRPCILKFAGGYHGGAASLAEGPFVVEATWNDIDSVERALASHPEVGAVFAEPFLGAGGVIPAAPGFLNAVQEMASRRGAVFVLDEIQGLRNGWSGEQGRLGLEPDLTLVGKIIGGGFPIGAVVGRRDLMALTSSGAGMGQIVHNGTFNGHILAAAAGLATLEALDAGAIDALNSSADRLASEIRNAATTYGLAVTVTTAGSILHVHSPTPQIAAVIHLALLLNGVYATPRGMLNLSTALGESDLAYLVMAYTRSFRHIAQAQD